MKLVTRKIDYVLLKNCSYLSYSSMKLIATKDNYTFFHIYENLNSARELTMSLYEASKDKLVENLQK